MPALPGFPPADELANRYAALTGRDVTHLAYYRAFSDFLPRADFSGSFGYEHVDSPARRSFPYNGKEFETGHATQSTVTITQTIFDGFRNDAAYDGARAQQGATEAQLESGTQAIMLEGISAYLEVLRNTLLVKLAYDSEANIMNQLNLEDERVRRGSGIAVDVLQAKSRLQIAKERRVAFEGAFVPDQAAFHVRDARRLQGVGELLERGWRAIARRRRQPGIAAPHQVDVAQDASERVEAPGGLHGRAHARVGSQRVQRGRRGDELERGGGLQVLVGVVGVQHAT